MMRSHARARAREVCELGLDQRERHVDVAAQPRQAELLGRVELAQRDRVCLVVALLGEQHVQLAGHEPWPDRVLARRTRSSARATQSSASS